MLTDVQNRRFFQQITVTCKPSLVFDMKKYGTVCYLKEKQSQKFSQLAPHELFTIEGVRVRHVAWLVKPHLLIFIAKLAAFSNKFVFISILEFLLYCLMDFSHFGFRNGGCRTSKLCGLTGLRSRILPCRPCVSWLIMKSSLSRELRVLPRTPSAGAENPNYHFHIHFTFTREGKLQC